MACYSGALVAGINYIFKEIVGESMSKAVLVMEMPENCFKCKLQDWATCRVTKKCHTGNNRPDWCPLKPLPEKQDIQRAKTMTSLTWIEGWNACIEAIEGEKIHDIRKIEE